MHKPRKRFGQHFLHDQVVIHKIISAIQPARKQAFIEIGPGKGAITIPLLKVIEKLEVVELDRDLIPILRQKVQREIGEDCQNSGHLIIHEADALTFDFCALAKKHQKLRLIGNLPYNISTPLLFHLLGQSDCIQDMHFMLQKEVVDRMTALPGSKVYGRLSVMIQYYCEVRSIFKISKDAFSPPPKVESAIVQLIPYENPPHPVKDEACLKLITHRAFGQRRKTLRNTLKGLLTDDEILGLNIDPGKRAETLDIEQFAALSNALYQHRGEIEGLAH